jgi:hypothetical protein
VTIADDQVRKVLLRRGFALEYATLAWNVAGIVVLAIAAIAARSVALAGFALDSLIEIGASTVVIWELSGTGEERQRRGPAADRLRVRRLGGLPAGAIYPGAGHRLSPTALGTRDHLDRGDRRGDVRARRG